MWQVGLAVCRNLPGDRQQLFTRIADDYQALLPPPPPPQNVWVIILKTCPRSGISSNTVRQRRETICGNDITLVGSVSLTVCLQYDGTAWLWLFPEV